MVAFRKFSIKCNFGHCPISLSLCLSGINLCFDSVINRQNPLLEIKDLTVDKASNIVVTMELSDKTTYYCKRQEKIVTYVAVRRIQRIAVHRRTRYIYFVKKGHLRKMCFKNKSKVQEKNGRTIQINDTAEGICVVLAHLIRVLNYLHV